VVLVSVILLVVAKERSELLSYASHLSNNMHLLDENFHGYRRTIFTERFRIYNKFAAYFQIIDGILLSVLTCPCERKLIMVNVEVKEQKRIINYVVFLRQKYVVAVFSFYIVLGNTKVVPGL
jgi:hypothetical protein